MAKLYYNVTLEAVSLPSLIKNPTIGIQQKNKNTYIVP